MTEQMEPTRRAGHRHEPRVRRYVVPHVVANAVKPSPAREEAHDPRSWFPLVAITHSGEHRHHSVRPMPSRPAVVVGRSPAREEAHDPMSWFPLAEIEALVAPEPKGETAPPPPVVVTPVVADPTPAPARIAATPATRAEIRRAHRSRRIRNRVRLAVAGAGLGVALFLAKGQLSDPQSSTATAEPEGGTEAPPVDAGREADLVATPAAASSSDPVADTDTARAIEPTGLSAMPTEQIFPPPPPAPPPPPPPLPNEDLWDAMAQCETGGNWQHHGPTWSGGLGIYDGTWDESGGEEFANLPRDATREQQIIVAERIRAKYGWTAWGCASAVGLS